ncbi:unnamed protein product [Caenorhabditis sp. 36 PRJEB53466]|nr:unnamed protein product [Caenorhabditis sp. 36 PRJEB53466]
MSQERSASVVIKNDSINTYFAYRALFKLEGVVNESTGWQMVKPQGTSTAAKIVFYTGLQGINCEWRLQGIKYTLAKDQQDPLAISFDGQRLTVEEVFIPDKNQWLQHNLADGDNNGTIQVVGAFPQIKIISNGSTTTHLFKRADL